MELFKLEPGLAIWTWITFGLLFFLLWKFLMPVLIKNIRDREEYLSSAVDNAREIEKRLQKIASEKEEILKAADKEADEILHRIRLEGETLRKELTKKAEAEAASLIEQARQAAAAEREAAMQELQKELAAFICDAAEQLVGMSVVGDKERAWTEETVKNL